MLASEEGFLEKDPKKGKIHQVRKTEIGIDRKAEPCIQGGKRWLLGEFWEINMRGYQERFLGRSFNFYEVKFLVYFFFGNICQKTWLTMVFQPTTCGSDRVIRGYHEDILHQNSKFFSIIGRFLVLFPVLNAKKFKHNINLLIRR